jgi:AcrR family transcriptional regulator
MSRPSARLRLLDCAESLFAEHGIASVSLRAINADAGLSPAALHYHFRSKDALVEALLERRMSELMARRAELFDQIEAEPGPPSARAVMSALLTPLAELISREADTGTRYLRFLCRLQDDGDIDERFVVDRFGRGVERIEPLLQLALPEIAAHTVRLRLALAIRLMLHGLADWQILAAAGRAGQVAPGLDEHVAALLDFITGGLEAPAPVSSPRLDSTTPKRSMARQSASRAGDPG